MVGISVRLVAPFIAGFVLLAGGSCTAFAAYDLSVVKPGCSLKKEWFGIVQAHPWVFWLKCGEQKFLVTHPLNLVGHVQIRSEDEALEFVRFFTYPDHAGCFALDGMVDVDQVAGTTAIDREVSSQKQKVRRDNSVTVFRTRIGKTLAFVVSRSVALADGRVQRIKEIVREDGYYEVFDRQMEHDPGPSNGKAAQELDEGK